MEAGISDGEAKPLPIRRSDIPTKPGVYICSDMAARSTWARLSNRCASEAPLKAHFVKGRDLSRNTLRASLAAAQLGIDRSVIWLRPSVMSFEQVTVVNQWLGTCAVEWIESPGIEEAHALDIDLREERLPALNRV